MKKFIIEKIPDKNGRIEFDGKDYRYLARVRRFAPGEYFPALLPDGTETQIKVISVDNRILTGEIISSGFFHNPFTPCLKTSLPPVYLFQALPKGDKMDLIVRQAAEGAVTGIVPFVSEFSSVRPKKDAGQKFQRWQRIVKEARQQSGSLTATEIYQPIVFDDLLLHWEQMKSNQPGILGLLFHHVPLNLKDEGLANESLHGYLCMKPETVVLAIGPEGGFSSAEACRFMDLGFKPFTIGNTILRTETAALYAAAAVRIILMERDSWETKK